MKTDSGVRLKRVGRLRDTGNFDTNLWPFEVPVLRCQHAGRLCETNLPRMDPGNNQHDITLFPFESRYRLPPDL